MHAIQWNLPPVLSPGPWTDISFCHLFVSVNRYSVRSVRKWVGARTGTYWDGVSRSEYYFLLHQTLSANCFLVRFQFILCPILYIRTYLHVGTISHLADIVFLIQICNEWNKRIFCYKNQWVSCWRININRWRQREYRYSNISDKTVNWILAEGRVRERYIRKGNKNRSKIERWIIFAGYFGLQHKPSTGTKTKRVQIKDEI